MCTGAEVAYLVVAAVGTGYTMYAQDTAAKQEEANLKYQSAQTAADAKAAQGAAEVEAMRIRKQAQAQRAEATAAAAAAGVDVNSPTAVKIGETITANGEEDALTTILNGQDTSARMNNQAAIDRTGASLARQNGRMQETATLLSSASSAYGNTSGWKKAA